MKLQAPAKINLALHVIGQRTDGYHLLESLVVFSRYGDDLTIKAAPRDSLDFSGPFGGLLAADPATNLVLKARDALRQAASHQPCPPVALHLEKNLPLSSGIGGGSADAAATLKGLNEYWGLGLTLVDLCTIGQALGSDVPMCLHGRPLTARGVGEQIEHVHLPEFHMVLVNPGVAVSTPVIFKALVKKDNGALPLISPSCGEVSPKAPERGDLSAFIDFLHSTRNDLQTPAIAQEPVIAEVIAELEASGAMFARMSGSGATCFGIFADGALRKEAAAEIRSNHIGWWVT